MTRLVYREEELMRSHDYAREHVVAGRRIHGGFDASGTYVPPRLAVREPAIAAWTDALRARGGDLLAADSSLLAGKRYPSEAQQKLLLQEGIRQPFWNSLTITGKIEGRGRFLAEAQFPELQDVICEDISEMAVGHLKKGLLVAHGIDEGGQPELGMGGHDVMWFAARDLAYGETDFPDPRVPERIGRPEGKAAEIEGLSLPHDRLVQFLLNLLMIEFRAELGFAFSQRLFRDPELFTQRRAESEEAAELIGRIRRDEEIHVTSLRLYLGELKSLTFRKTDGEGIPGAEVIDPIWRTIVHWATVEQPKLVAERERKSFKALILTHPDGLSILDRFDGLEAA